MPRIPVDELLARDVLRAFEATADDLQELINEFNEPAKIRFRCHYYKDGRLEAMLASQGHGQSVRAHLDCFCI